MSGSLQEDTYREEVPEHVDKSQEEWDTLSYHAQYYHVEKLREEQVEYKKHRRAELRGRVNEFKGDSGCINCDEDEPVCLDLHHTADDKEYGIARLVDKCASWERIESEMRKCVVVCSNCHRKHTHGVLDLTE